MPATALRRPGIVFEHAAPPLDDVLPRMDIAGFVGFAERGPLDVPVAVEDEAQFAAIFGGEPLLAWDAARGESVYGHLAGAVRAFFAAGGRRCWVVRVAGAPETARFAVPGLARVRPQANRPQRLQPAVLAAASPGAWADGLSVGVSLLVAGLPVTAIRKAVGGLELDVAEGAGEALVAGDVLRVTFTDARRILHAVVLVPGAHVRVRVGAWLAPVEPDPGTLGEARWSGEDGRLLRAPARVDGSRVRLGTAVIDAPEPGTLLRVRLPGRRIAWMAVREAHDDGDGVMLEVGPAWRLAGGQALPEFDPRRDPVERLELELATREAGREVRRATGLGLAVEHPRYAGALPDDAARFRPPAGGEPPTRPSEIAVPLAADEPPRSDELLVPFAVEAVPALWQRRMRGPEAAAPALERDGLADLGAVAFADPRLAMVGVHALRDHAAALQLAGAAPLRGVHALLEIDEVTVIAAPDAVQPGWTPATPPGLPPSRVTPGPGDGARTDFRRCDAAVLRAPALVRRASAPETVALAWELEDAPPGVAFRVERAARADWSDAATVYAGAEQELALHGLPPGAHRFRVRAEAGSAAGPWSSPVDVLAAAPPASLAGAGPAVYPRVHRVLATIAAARGDVLALLALPRDLDIADAERYLGELAGAIEEHTRSHVAAYHPWPVTAGAGATRALPPDGAAAGLIAARALRAGSWTAPANEPVPAALTLSPLLLADHEDRLRRAGVNVLAPTPRGVAWLSADTLSLDPDLRPITVRRLLSLLRRVALRYGPGATFEPLGAEVRRAVRRDFDGLLALLHQAGALAGASAAEAYRVDVLPPDAPGVGEGQLVVELRVAPSRPLVFLTVRLVVG